MDYLIVTLWPWIAASGALGLAWGWFSCSRG
jgi:hypothetical protein